MNREVVLRATRPRVVLHTRHRNGFSLVELLTVIFIISALLALLVPSMNAARNTAKKTSTMATFKALEAGLEMFRGDNRRSFPRTHGYPPSFSHPRMRDASGKDIFDPNIGAYPFNMLRPVVSGAHWLAVMLMGVDQQGYIKRETVPKRENLRDEPWRWYRPDPLGDGTVLERAAFYVDPDAIRTVRTRDLPGRSNPRLFKLQEPEDLWADEEPYGPLPVFVDAFGLPILYYAAQANGRTTNMLSEKRDAKNKYAGGAQEQGPPYYFHQDNQIFTGNEHANGWIFDAPHRIARPGDKYTADELVDTTNAEAQESFARFIVDRKLYGTMYKKVSTGSGCVSRKSPLRPVNADSYLLISAGADSVYGTSDDNTNFPLSVD